MLRSGISELIARETENPTAVTVVEGLEERLASAAEKARERLLGSSDIPPAVEIINKVGTTIVVEDLVDTHDYHEYFLVYENAFLTSSPMIKVPKDKYRYVYFKGLRDCRIFIKCKLLRLMFHDCDQCQISITSPVVGMVEFYQCVNTNANIRIPTESTSPIPMTRIEECRKFNLFQSNDELFYIVKKSVDITGTIVNPVTKERQTTYHLSPTRLQFDWSGPQHQTLVRLSRDEGFASGALDYALNNIGHTLVTRGLDDSDAIVNDLIIGTPPI